LASAPALLSFLSLHDALPIFGAGADRPQDHPRHLGALADAVARGDVFLDDAALLPALADGLADAGQLLALPFLRPSHVLQHRALDRKSTRLNSSHVKISYAVF